MNSIIYVQNKKNEFIGMYKLKEVEEQISRKEKRRNYYNSLLNSGKGKDIYTNDIDSNIQGKTVDSIEKQLKIEKFKISIIQFKFLSIKQNYVYFIVVLDTYKNYDLSGNYFEKLVQYESLYKEGEKIYKSYQQKKEKAKNKTIRDSYKSIFTKWDLVRMIILIITFVLSLVLLDIDNDGKSKIVVILNIVMVLLPSIKHIFDICERYYTFKMNRNTSIFIEGKRQEEIMSGVIDPHNFTKKYAGFEAMSFGKNEAFIYSDKENETFDKNCERLKVSLNKDKHKMTSETRKVLACVIKDKRDNNKSIFNGNLIGINSDLNFRELTQVNLKKVNYFTYVSTDEMIFKNVYLPQDNHQIIEGYKVSINHMNNSLFNIENSHLTNLIGINLIVEVKLKGKSYYVINRQNLTNDVNQRRFVPSASGSLDQKDYNKLKKLKYDSFKELLKIGMLRELKEESYIDITDYENYSNNLGLEFECFKLLGFARLVSKSGKPDFFGKITFRIDDESQIEQILENYNNSQNTNLKKIETFAMHIVSQKELFKNKDNYSPQLSYMIHLLKVNINLSMRKNIVTQKNKNLEKKEVLAN